VVPFQAILLWILSIKNPNKRLKSTSLPLGDLARRSENGHHNVVQWKKNIFTYEKVKDTAWQI